MRVHAKVLLFGGESGPEALKSQMASLHPGSVVQAVGVGTVRNSAMAEMLAAQTFRAMASKSLLAKKPEVDLLLRLAGTTQISKAIKEKGAKAGEPFLLVVASRSALGRFRRSDGEELPRAPLTTEELERIEAAALLDAARG